VIVVDVDGASLARLRMRPSPAHELVWWLRLVAHRRRHPTFGDPGASARSALFDADVALVAAALPASGYVPDLLTPKPAPGSSQVLEDQLETVALTAADVVVEQLRAHRPRVPLPQPLRAAAESGSFARRAAHGMRKFWRLALDDGWAQLRTTLERDIDARGRAVTRAGIGAVLGSLHPTLRWDGQRLEVHKPYDEATSLQDNDLVLAPSALGWPGMAVQLSDPTDLVISYPADGIGIDTGPTTPARLATAELIGASRNQLLRQLEHPRSTTELTTRTGLAPATISHHLSVLLRSGLLTRERRGRSVLYQRTPNAEALLTQSASANGTGR
jgi:DNA-binding transcriptional ArsR family regulator